MGMRRAGQRGIRNGARHLCVPCRGGQALWPTNPNGGRAPHARPLFYSLTFSGQRERPRGRGWVGGRVPASKKASDGDPHPGPSWGACPFSATEMLPPSPLVEAAVGRLSAAAAAKSSSLSALAEAGSTGPARPPWAAGRPQQSKKGRRCRALSSRSSLRRGVRGRRRPDTPKPHPRRERPAPRARGVQEAPAPLGRPGSLNGAPKRRGFVRAPLGMRAVGGMRCARCRESGDGESSRRALR